MVKNLFVNNAYAWMIGFGLMIPFSQAMEPVEKELSVSKIFQQETENLFRNLCEIGYADDDYREKFIYEDAIKGNFAEQIQERVKNRFINDEKEKYWQEELSWNYAYREDYQYFLSNDSNNEEFREIIRKRLKTNPLYQSITCKKLSQPFGNPVQLTHSVSPYLAYEQPHPIEQSRHNNDQILPPIPTYDTPQHWLAYDEAHRKYHERCFDTLYVSKLQGTRFEDFLYDQQEGATTINKISAQCCDLMIWIKKGSYGDSRTVALSDLPEGSYIAWFGTSHKGFDQVNGDSNGYAWLSNYHEAKKRNPNASFVPNYQISIMVNGQLYSTNNIETFYHMYKNYSSGKAIDYSAFSKYSPNEARTAVLNVRNFNFRKSDQVMYHLLQQKFFNNNLMAKHLLETGDFLLFEGNQWKDERFGMILNNNSILRGENKLGKMLTRIRDELKDKRDNDQGFAKFVNEASERNHEWIKPFDFNSF